jgi:hypothetical protein
MLEVNDEWPAICNKAIQSVTKTQLSSSYNANFSNCSLSASGGPFFALKISNGEQSVHDLAHRIQQE